MALLDRFRTQSGHKNPDAAARLQFVQEMPLDERDLLTEVAREDPDPRVRRAAVAKLMDPAALAGVAKADADEQVRAQALSMLRDIALEAFEGFGEAEASRRSPRSRTPKTLVGIAKNASREVDGGRARWRASPIGTRSDRLRGTPSTKRVRRAAFERAAAIARAAERRAEQRIQGSDAGRRRTDHRSRRARADRLAGEEQERVQARPRHAARD